jgi:hypothetical protein
LYYALLPIGWQGQFLTSDVQKDLDRRLTVRRREVPCGLSGDLPPFLDPDPLNFVERDFIAGPDHIKYIGRSGAYRCIPRPTATATKQFDKMRLPWHERYRGPMRKKITVIFSALAGETQCRSHEIEIASTGDAFADCQAVFNLLNDPEMADVGLNPLAGKERALSPGDGIIIDGVIYRCCMLGWREIDDLGKLKATNLFE